MRASAAAARVALLALLAPCGCSFLIMRSPPNPVTAPDVPAPCPTSRVPPAADVALAAASLLLIPIAMYGEATNDTGVYSEPAHPLLEARALGALGVTAFGTSALVGFLLGNGCRKFKPLNERCAGGDLSACTALAPGWSPATATAKESPDRSAPAPSRTREPWPTAATPRRRDLGLRVGYAHATGEVQRGEPLSRVTEMQVPIQLDATVELWPRILVGPYASFGLGPERVIRGGLQAVYAPRRPSARLLPWAGVGAGLEWLSAPEGWYNGAQLVLQAGAQYAIRERRSIGPYLQLSLGEYGSGADRTNGVHRWLEIGIRASFER